MRAAPLADAAPVPVAPGVDDVPEFIPGDAVSVPPGPGWVPVLMLPLPAVLLAGGRTAAGDAPGLFRTSSEHGVEAPVDSVVEVQRRSARPASTPDGLVWASAEPASRSTASGASETGEGLFMASP